MSREGSVRTAQAVLSGLVEDDEPEHPRDALLAIADVATHPALNRLLLRPAPAEHGGEHPLDLLHRLGSVCFPLRNLCPRGPEVR